uniref:C-type natriuretic peptide 2 n=1 Tax=Seriola lalandi dorsalis TaxID=1841481 RepID=A0A3B4X199_SERLL
SSSSSSSFGVPLLSHSSSSSGDKRQNMTPERQINDRHRRGGVLHSLFGSRLSSLILDPPTADDVTEGSAGRPAPSALSPSRGLALSHGAAGGLVGKQEAVPRFFLDFLRRQAKMRRRSRKSMVGGRGCFGMKMDRIGSISGLGC